MELIAGLETEPRGVYCGAIGHISPNGRTLLNVAIRTAVVFRDSAGEMGIGSGVVFDSQGSREYAECLLKMKFLTDPVKPFELIETMLYEPGSGFALLERHLERLATSARYFGFACDEGAVRTALAQAVEGKQQRLRVRLLLPESGAVAVTTTPLPAPEAAPVMAFVVSPTRIDSADIFLFHKTTRRELYDTAMAALRGGGRRRGHLSQRARRAHRGQPHHDLPGAGGRPADAGAGLRAVARHAARRAARRRARRRGRVDVGGSAIGGCRLSGQLGPRPRARAIAQGVRSPASRI